MNIPVKKNSSGLRSAYTHDKKLFYVIILIAFGFMMFLNCKCGYISDDYHFNFVWKDFYPTENEKKISSIYDIIESLKNYYNLSGGRVLPHFWAFVMVNLNKGIYNVLNSMIFVIYGYVIYKIVYKRKMYNHKLLTAIYISLFLFIPLFGDNILWISGSANYHWPVVLFLCSILYFQNHYDDNSTFSNIVIGILFIFSSLTNEFTGGMIVVWTLSFMILNKRKFSKRIFIFWLLCIPASCTVVLAPGNFHRAENIEKVQLFDFSSVISLVLRYFGWFFMNYSLPLNLIIISAVVFLICKKTKYIKTFLPYIITFTAGLTALTFTDFFTRRPLIFQVSLMIIAFWICILNLIKIIFTLATKSKTSDKICAIGNKICFTLVLLSSVFISVHTYLYCIEINEANEYMNIKYEMLYTENKVYQKDLPLDSKFIPVESVLSLKDEKNYTISWLKVFEDSDIEKPCMRGF